MFEPLPIFDRVENFLPASVLDYLHNLDCALHGEKRYNGWRKEVDTRIGGPAGVVLTPIHNPSPEMKQTLRSWLRRQREASL